MKDLWPSTSRSALTAIASFERPGGPQRTGKPTIPGLVETFRGPKHLSPHAHVGRSPWDLQTRSGWKPWAASPARTARGIARTFWRKAQTGQRDFDPARVAESCSQRRHRGRCADAPSWRVIGKVRLGCAWARRGPFPECDCRESSAAAKFPASAIRVRPPDPDKDWGEVHAGGANRMRYQWGRHLKLTPEQTWFKAG